jgi:hypothetical protein
MISGLPASTYKDSGNHSYHRDVTRKLLRILLTVVNQKLTHMPLSRSKHVRPGER